MSLGREIAAGETFAVPGPREIEDNRKVVKHRDGGIISKVLVRDGQTVAEGDTADETAAANKGAAQVAAN